MKKSIVILFHESARRYRLKKYIISILAEVWCENGHSVRFLFGTKDFIPADICIVHVDLSEVPESYIEFANRYPVVANGNINNIRKSHISNNIVSAGDGYQGKVVVKTDLNYAGWPELVANKSVFSLMFLKALQKSGVASTKFMSQLDYKVYDRFVDVPSRYVNNSSYVIEKFLPELENGIYCLNSYYFFGDVNYGVRIYSAQPIVNGSVQVKREFPDPHPGIIKIQRQLGIDFGKLDYSIVNDRVVLFDVNKTNAIALERIAPKQLELIKNLANGISSFF